MVLGRPRDIDQLPCVYIVNRLPSPGKGKARLAARHLSSAKSLQFLMDPPYERDFLQAEGPDEENPPLLQKVFFGRKAIPPRCRLDRIPGKTSFQPGSSAEITF